MAESVCAKKVFQAGWRRNLSNRYNGTPTDEGYGRGFRVASVPEPASLLMLVMIALAALPFGKRLNV